MNNLKLSVRLLIIFCLSIFLTLINTSLWANNPQLYSNQQLINAPELVENGQKFYNLGQYQSSINNLEQAATIFANQGDMLNQAITLSNLSLAYQDLGNWEKAENAIASSLDLLGYKLGQEISYFTAEKQNIIASILNIYGRFFYQKGNANLALEHWQKSENIYQLLNNQQGIISTKINQVQALQTLGNFQQAYKKIIDIQTQLEDAPLIKIQSLKTLGEILLARGELNKSQEILQQSLELAKNNDSQKTISDNLLSLGNTYWALGKLESDRQNISKNYDFIPWQCLSSPSNNYYDKAINNYQEVININSEFNNVIKAKINLFNLLVETGNFNDAKQTFNSINLNKLTPSQTNIYAKINVARHLSCVTNLPEANKNEQIKQILIQSITEAKQLQDNRALSYAYGNLGGFYEYLSLENLRNSELITKAQNLTEQAILFAQPSNAPSIAYQWQWQLGRIYARLGNQKEAINSYQNAVATLQKVRSDLVNVVSDVQFSFRDNVEPIYRQLAKLLLNSDTNNLPETNLLSAVNLIDSLQLAELENFLNCDLSTIAVNLPNIDKSSNTAFIYPIILEDSFNVIYKLPNQSLQAKVNLVSRKEVEETVNNLEKAIHERNPEDTKENSIKLYQWLIQPLDTYLEPNIRLNNLIFVLDGVLRNIPMAVLYDSQKKEYVIEKDYSIALLPTSQLFNIPSSGKLNRVLAAGIDEELTLENQKFTKINAQEELEKIKELVPADVLLNSEFTDEIISQKLKQENYNIVHFATHGKFSSDLQDTFLLSYTKLLRTNDLSYLLSLNNQIDLLILTACNTAEGDNRAILGLAGLAIKAGAKSTVASLWEIKDEYTIPLITRFYENLNQGLSKAEALHQAQKSLVYLDFNGKKLRNDPKDWGAYVLIGNWQ